MARFQSAEKSLVDLAGTNGPELSNQPSHVRLHAVQKCLLRVLMPRFEFFHSLIEASQHNQNDRDDGSRDPHSVEDSWILLDGLGGGGFPAGSLLADMGAPRAPCPLTQE